jgi:hypothetical protein
MKERRRATTVSIILLPQQWLGTTLTGERRAGCPRTLAKLTRLSARSIILLASNQDMDTRKMEALWRARVRAVILNLQQTNSTSSIQHVAIIGFTYSTDTRISLITPHLPIFRLKRRLQFIVPVRRCSILRHCLRDFVQHPTLRIYQLLRTLRVHRALRSPKHSANFSEPGVIL